MLYSRSHYCLHFPDRDAGSRSHEAPRQGHTCILSPQPTLPPSLTLKRTVREGRDCDNPAQTHPGQASLDQKCTLGSSSVIRGSGPPARPSPHLVRAELCSMYSNLSLKEHRCLHAPQCHPLPNQLKTVSAKRDRGSPYKGNKHTGLSLQDCAAQNATPGSSLARPPKKG